MVSFRGQRKRILQLAGRIPGLGDEVEIRVAEITPEEITPPTEIHKQGTVPPLSKIDDPELWADKLYTYLRYKKILEDEGLI